MAENLFHEARRYGAPATAESLSALVSEPLDRTELALDHAIAVVFAAFTHDATKEEALGRLHQLLTEATEGTNPLYALPDALRDRTRAARLVAKGDELLGLVFRGRLPSATDYVATASGVSRQHARGILTIAAPIAWRIVGRAVVTGQADTAELRRLLLAERPAVQAVLGTWGTKLFFDDGPVVDDKGAASQVTWEHRPPTRYARTETRVWLWFELGALGLLGAIAVLGLCHERALGVVRGARLRSPGAEVAVLSAQVPRPTPVILVPDQEGEAPRSSSPTGESLVDACEPAVQ